MDFIIFVMNNPLIMLVLVLVYYYGIIGIVGWIASKLLDKILDLL